MRFYGEYQMERREEEANHLTAVDSKEEQVSNYHSAAIMISCTQGFQATFGRKRLKH